MNTRTAAVAAVMGAVLLVAGCSGKEAPADGSSKEVEAAESSAPEPTPSESASVAPPTTTRGNIPKKVGEPAGYGNSVDDLKMKFTVDNITVNPECSTDFAVAPAGHLVRLDMTVTTTPDAVEWAAANGHAILDGFYFGSAGFTVFDSDGVRVNDANTDAAIFCAASEEWLPTPVGPGQTAKGAVFLESPTEHGFVMFTDQGGATGWEYEF